MSKGAWVAMSVVSTGEGDPAIEVISHADQGLVALLGGSSGNLGPAIPLAVARNAITKFVMAQDAVPSESAMHDLMARIARAVRQAETILVHNWEREEPFDLARARSCDGSPGTDVGPDIGRYGPFGFFVEAAITWVATNSAVVAASGSCGGLLARKDALVPLHKLSVLLDSPLRPKSLSEEAAARVVTSALGVDGSDLTGRTVVRTMSLSGTDRVVLTSPEIAIPILSFGKKPSAALLAEPPHALLRWLMELIPDREGWEGHVDGGAAIVVPV